MSEAINLSLQITLVGMGLVFGAILLLWVVMAALVRLTDEKAEPASPAQTLGETGLGAPEAGELDRKRQAAAAAVTIALAQLAQRDEPHEFPLPATSIVSAWQAVMRTRILTKRGPTR